MLLLILTEIINKVLLMNGKKSILIVGLTSQTAISLLRSFGKKRIQVYGINNKKNANYYSKYLTKGYIFSEFDMLSGFENNEKLIDYIEQIIKKHEIDYVITFFDSLIILLNKYRYRLEKITKLLIPGEDSFIKTIDKNKTLKIAKKLKIPVPETIVVTDLNDLDKCKDLDFPVVVKPSSRYYKNHVQAERDFKRHYFHSYQNLLIFFKKYNPCKYKPVFVQEFCNGEDIGFPIFFKKGRCITCMQYKVVRMYPHNGGSPICRETTKTDPELKEYSLRLLSYMEWDGIAEIDYIKDNKDGKIKMLEVNGRFWASLPLAEKAGLDFPSMLYSSDDDIRKASIFKYKIGTKCRILSSDTAWLSDILFNRAYKENIAIPTKSSAILSYLKSFGPRTKYDFGSWDDPLPLLGDFLLSVYAFRFGFPRQRSAVVFD